MNQFKDDPLCGNDLSDFVENRFRQLAQELWSDSVAKEVTDFGCAVVDHARGLKSWAAIGTHVITINFKSDENSNVDYDPIRDRTRAGIEEHLRDHLLSLRQVISERIGRGAAA